MDNKTSSRLRGCADLNLRWAHMYVAGHIHLNVNYLSKFKSSCSQSTNFRNVKIPSYKNKSYLDFPSVNISVRMPGPLVNARLFFC